MASYNWMNYLKVFRLYLFIFFMSILVRLMNYVPPLKTKFIKFLKEQRKNLGKQIESIDDFVESLYKWSSMKSMISQGSCDIWKTAKLGQRAPDALAFCLKRKSIVNILDMQQHGRPLVINFGSCT